VAIIVDVARHDARAPNFVAFVAIRALSIMPGILREEYGALRPLRKITVVEELVRVCCRAALLCLTPSHELGLGVFLQPMPELRIADPDFARVRDHRFTA